MPGEKPLGCNCLWPEIRYSTGNQHARSCAIQRREENRIGCFDETLEDLAKLARDTFNAGLHDAPLA
jgi:hypothetical protein